MIPLTSGLSYVDLRFRGLPRIIATAVVQWPGGVALIDPGPTSTLANLDDELARAGISWADVRHLLLTHIHLDHAGAAGTIVRAHPHVRVYVHEKGAPHLMDPTRLLSSATRLYGDEMDRLWGEVRAVPQEVLTVLRGGERIDLGRPVHVAYTPGHASHHVSYFIDGIAFVGDTTGVRVVPDGYVLPATPPPDVELVAWKESLERIAAWHPDALFLTHFGPSAPARTHVSAFTDHLEWTSALVKASIARAEADEAREAAFIDEIRRELRRHMSEADAQAYEVAGRFDLSWRGLARYWMKATGVR